jgi:hypothetical protein
MNRIRTAAAAVAVTAALSFTAAPAADAHSPCTGTCNTFLNQSRGVGVGIYDYASSANWSWILQPGGWSAGWNIYQRDTEGFYVGPGYCAQVWQSNDNYNYGYWGVARQGKFTSTYWAYTKVNAFVC